MGQDLHICSCLDHHHLSHSEQHWLVHAPSGAASLHEKWTWLQHQGGEADDVLLRDRKMIQFSCRTLAFPLSLSCATGSSPSSTATAWTGRGKRVSSLPHGVESFPWRLVRQSQRSATVVFNLISYSLSHSLHLPHWRLSLRLR